jgi:molybdopterin molybdotransferase
MVEYTEPFGTDEIAVYSAVANGENVVQIAEDMKEGDLLLHRGKRLLPQDIGALAAIGVAAVSVLSPPRLTILSTGDELISLDNTPKRGQIRDINTHALTALAQKCGYRVVHSAVLADDENTLEQALRDAMPGSDIVVVSGGSSYGKKDITGTVIDRVSSPGVFTHGLAIKPGKPTILAYDALSETILAGLPGHPVSAMIVFELIFGRLLRELANTPHPHLIPAQISCNVASSPGKHTCLPVMLKWENDAYIAEPIFGKSGLITTLTNADGFVTIERDTEGLSAGATVKVHLF